MKSTKSNFTGYIGILLIIVVAVFIFIKQGKKDKTQEGSMDKGSVNTQVTDTNKGERRYEISTNNNFIVSVPNKETDSENYNKVHDTVVKALADDGFEENEINFDKGVSYRIVKDNQLIGYRIEWPIPTGCKLVMRYTSDYNLESSYIGCR